MGIKQMYFKKLCVKFGEPAPIAAHLLKLTQKNPCLNVIFKKDIIIFEKEAQVWEENQKANEAYQARLERQTSSNDDVVPSGMIKTNMGLMPLEDYLEISAYSIGYDSYKEAQEAGIVIAP